jgi:uncharacterized protein (DUF4415 family)
VTEAEIASTSPPELANLPDDFWDAAERVPPVIKQPISIRLDGDVLAWFRTQGPRYQSRINAVLRAYMEAVSARSARTGSDARPGRRARR